MKLGLAMVMAILCFCIASLATSIISIHNEHHTCAQVEALKDRVRQRAIDDYNSLDRNAHLLGIKLTPQLRAATLKSRNRVLSDYAPQDCGGYFG